MLRTITFTTRFSAKHIHSQRLLNSAKILSKNKNLFQKRNVFILPNKEQVSEAKVVRYEQHGQPKKVLQVVTEPLPSQLRDNEVLIRFVFGSINPSDINMIEGTYPILPKLPAYGGSEGVADVAIVGKGVKKLKVGDVVIPLKTGFGTWRNFAITTEDQLLAINTRNIQEVPQLCAVAINPTTAYRLLHDFVPLKEGDVIIQNAANGAVGQAVIQIAKHKGIKTINIIRQRPLYNDIAKRLQEIGGTVVVSHDYLKQDEMRALISDLPKPKLALNAVGGESATELARLLAPGGTLVTYGAMSKKPVTIPNRSLIFNDIRLRGFWLTKWNEEHTVEERLKTLDELIKLIKQGDLRAFIELHKLSDFSLALDRATKEYTGRKIIIDLHA